MPQPSTMPRALLPLLLPLLALAAPAAAAPPHIVFFMVDDWGWNEVGYHHVNSGAPAREVSTPHIDALSQAGIRLERHYAYQWCTPSRSSFLSGRLPVHIADSIGSVCIPDEGIPQNMTTIASKLKSAGYKTHALGKWDAGMATPTKTPHGRGFDTSLGYFDHENDYYKYTPQTPQAACKHGEPADKLKDLWDTDQPATALVAQQQYEESVLYQRAESILQAHDPNDPLFLYYAFHIVHAPLEVPQVWENKFSFINDSRPRRLYHAMVSYMDEVVYNVTNILKAKGMWNNTLVVSSSDNGGPVYPGGGSNNFPLKGGKVSDFEGGIRVNSWVSGGLVPEPMRGTSINEYMHLADWYATFCHLAGVDPHDGAAAQAGLPPVDSLNMWPLLSGQNATSPRTSMQISMHTYIDGPWKLIWGSSTPGQLGGPTDQSFWQGPIYPNATNPAGGYPDAVQNCTAGCLYNIVADPTEHNEISAQNPAKLEEMKALLLRANATRYEPPSTDVDPACCATAFSKYGGFIGPWLDV